MIRSRQAELVDSQILNTPTTVIGAGAIGSFVVLTLAKMGFHNISVYDNDSVSPENISNQFYRYEDIGWSKTGALIRMIESFENIFITGYADKFRRTDELSDVVIMAVDSMTSRHEIYKSIKDNKSVLFFLDGRMGGQQAEIHAYENSRKNRINYEKYLWEEAEASELRCTQKAVMYNVLWIASGICNSVRLMLEGKPYKNIQYMDFENQNQSHVEVS
jgi:molybdopterin/thiamine biosynthesis adenylyltransferase